MNILKKADGYSSLFIFKVWYTVGTTVAPQECVGWRVRDSIDSGGKSGSNQSSGTLDIFELHPRKVAHF